MNNRDKQTMISIPVILVWVAVIVLAVIKGTYYMIAFSVFSIAALIYNIVTRKKNR